MNIQDLEVKNGNNGEFHLSEKNKNIFGNIN